MLGLGKRRTKLGKWLDARGIKQEWLIKKSGGSKGTVTNVCSEDGYMPSGTTIQKIIKAVKEVDASVKATQFWDL